jgi:hypothetical protein
MLDVRCIIVVYALFKNLSLTLLSLWAWFGVVGVPLLNTLHAESDSQHDKMGEGRKGALHWLQQRVPIEYLQLALLIYLSTIDEPEVAHAAPHSQSSPHHSAAAQLMQCDARAGALLTLAPAFCPTRTATATVAAAVTSFRKLELASADYLTWDEAKELLTYLPFVLFRFPDHKGAGLLAILASHFTDGPKAPTPKDTLAIPTTNDTNPTSTTSATPTHLAVKNRFARSFSQLVASQLVPGDLITMAKSQGILTNMGVDYVVVFRFATTG